MGYCSNNNPIKIPNLIPQSYSPSPPTSLPSSSTPLPIPTSLPPFPLSIAIDFLHHRLLFVRRLDLLLPSCRPPTPFTIDADSLSASTPTPHHQQHQRYLPRSPRQRRRHHFPSIVADLSFLVAASPPLLIVLAPSVPIISVPHPATFSPPTAAISLLRHRRLCHSPVCSSSRCRLCSISNAAYHIFGKMFQRGC